MKRAKQRKLRIRTKSEHVTPVGGNVFLDLGFEPEEAARLLAEADTRLDAVVSAVVDVSKAIPGASLVEMPVQNEDRIFLTQRETLRLIEIMENVPPRTEKFIQAMDEYLKRKLDDNDTSIDWSPEKYK